MGRVAALLIIAGVVILGAGYYLTRGTPEGMKTPTQAISDTGVKSDLLSFAQAERLYQAEHGSYASLAELESSGALSASRREREGYSYEAETSSSHFRITARCSSTPERACNSYSIDETMDIQQLP